MHFDDHDKRIALIDTPTIDTLSTGEVQLLRYQYGNNISTASLELDENAALITYEEYYPYGNTSYQGGRSVAECSLKRYRYTGKERDEESGLNYHGARYYAPWLARWCACEPLANELYVFKHNSSGGSDDLLLLSVYCYCENCPVKYIDPNGEQIVVGGGTGTDANPYPLPAVTITAKGKNQVDRRAGGEYHSSSSNQKSGSNIFIRILQSGIRNLENWFDKHLGSTGKKIALWLRKADWWLDSKAKKDERVVQGYVVYNQGTNLRYSSPQNPTAAPGSTALDIKFILGAANIANTPGHPAGRNAVEKLLELLRWGNAARGNADALHGVDEIKIGRINIDGTDRSPKCDYSNEKFDTFSHDGKSFWYDTMTNDSHIETVSFPEGKRPTKWKEFPSMSPRSDSGLIWAPGQRSTEGSRNQSNQNTKKAQEKWML